MVHIKSYQPGRYLPRNLKREVYVFCSISVHKLKNLQRFRNPTKCLLSGLVNVWCMWFHVYNPVRALTTFTTLGFSTKRLKVIKPPAVAFAWFGVSRVKPRMTSPRHRELITMRIVPRVRPTLTRFPTKIISTPVDSTLLNTIPRMWCPMGNGLR